MAHGQTGKTGHAAFARVIKRSNSERWLEFRIIAFSHVDHIRQGSNFVDEFAHLLGVAAVIQRGHQLDRLFQALEVGFKLFLNVGVKHDGLPNQ